MQFGVLGPLEVRSADGEALSVGGPRPRALLTMLLLDAGRVVTVEQLIAGQYGDDPPAGAANAVQAQVSRLRRSLAADVIEFHSNGYRLTVDPEDVDAHRFERLARDGRRLLDAGQHASSADTLRAALELWRGPALVDLPHGQSQAVRLDELRLAATEDLIEAELALPAGTSVAELGRLVATHPLRERLRGQLMRALYTAGRQAEALNEFEAARRLLADELGVDPSPELTAVHLAILRAEQPEPPTRRGVAAQLTSFTGREQELARLAEHHTARLVTLLGPGGIGKTRLAVESAAAGRRDICFVDLAPLDASDPVAPAVLGALGLRDPGFPASNADPIRRLVAALNQDLLLILDNCEHVVASAAALARTLLAECPELAILATSREPLGLTGETLVPVAPLETAPADVSPGDALAYPAVRLFADRAAAVRPGFAVDQDTVAAVIEVCATLDGLPLAIELAAARLRQFTVDDLAVRLAEHGRFRLLSRGDRTAAARHRTLAAVVEWSWDLLGPAERTLARRFAVFTGGAPLAAVEAVCGVADADAVLADLVDRSLVETDGARYQMLDTIRLYCAERLAEVGELESLRRAHARYHLDLARRADAHLFRAEQLDWLALLAAEHGNLMAALRWSVREQRATAYRLVAALSAYWWLSGRRGEAGASAAALLTEVPDGLAEEYVSCVVHAAPRADAEHWARAERIMRTAGRELELRHPFGVALWGMVAGPSAAPPEHEPLPGDDPWNAALGQLSQGLLALLGGRTAEGERELLAVLARFRALGERWGTAQALDWLAEVAGWRGEWARAHELWAEALAKFEQLGALEECVDVLCRRAACLVRQGDPVAAGADYRRAAELSAKAGQPELPLAVQLGLAEIARLSGDTGDARNRLGHALESAQNGSFGTDGNRAMVLTALGRLAETAGDADEAVRRHREALTAVRASPLTSDLAIAAEGQAGAALLTGADERAALLLGAAVALRGMAVTGDLDVARIASGARERLGATAFAAAYSRGAAMSPEQALTALDGSEP